MNKIKFTIILFLVTLSFVACDNKDDLSVLYGNHTATGLLKGGNPINDSVKSERLTFYKSNTLSVSLLSDGTCTINGINSTYKGTWTTNRKGSISFSVTLTGGTSETNQFAKEFIDYVTNATYYEADNNQFSLYKNKGEAYVLFN